ncbi:diphthamide biosynthesis protein 4 [[Candida] anglica]
MSSHYDVLGVAPNSTTSEIKRAYREKLLLTHPDKVGGELSTDLIQQIQLAYKVLSDETHRQEYDDELARGLQKQGFNINGEGLDIYSLEEFEFDEDAVLWHKMCGRCQAPEAIKLEESDLELGTDDGEGGLELVVQCNSCSLWIKVRYMEETDE